MIDRTKQVTKTANRKLDELYKTHLCRDHLIGDDHDAVSKTLIDHVLEKLPLLNMKCKKNEDATGQTTFILKNF